MKKDLKRINILGFDPLIYGSEEKIHHGTEHIEKEGYHTVYVDIETLKENKYETTNPDWIVFKAEHDAYSAVANWVVSAAAMPAATYMYEKYSIPYVKLIPIGAVSMKQWLNKLLGSIDREYSVEVPAMAAVNENAPSIAVIGAPLLTMGITRCLRNEFGIANVKKYVYCKDDDAEINYRKQLPLAQVEYFETIGELKNMISDAEIIICDPKIAENFPEKKHISVPYPLISGNMYTDTDYRIFGKKGAAYLKMQLAPYVKFSEAEMNSMDAMNK